MIAFKTFSQAPEHEAPSGIPGDWPWVEISIQPSEQNNYQALNYTVMQDAEYSDYKNARLPAFAIWAAANNYGENPLAFLTDLKAQQGFSIYRELVAALDSGGGLGSIDQGLEVYALIVPIRNLLKDGFFTYALRYYCKNVRTLNLFPNELDAQFISVLRSVCAVYGATESELNNIETGENV